MSQSNDAVPRPLTAAARRQSWRELPVRVWSLVTLGVVVVILGVGVQGILRSNADRRLLREGVRVDATIDVISGASRNVDRSVQRVVDLSFLLPGEAERRELNRVTLEPTGGPAISRGDKLPILVDPKDPRVWTDRVEPASWLIVLATPLLLLPLAIALAAVTALTRSRIVKLYQSGTLRQASVVDAHRSALVPGQKIVKFSLPDAARVLSAAHPDALGAIAAGETIDVIVDATKPTRAIIARAYVSPLSPVVGAEG